MKTDDFSRREVLQAMVATMAALPLGWPEMALLAHESPAVAQPAGGTGRSLLSAAEAAEIEAITAQIIPSGSTPGAREAGVVNFIDRALATFLSQLAGEYRGQLAEFQAAFRQQQPGAASFAALTSAQQVAYLATVDHTPFFGTTRLLTLLAMFSLPDYRGNRNGVGWKLIGFEDRHFFQPPFGYYDRDYPGFVVDRVIRP